MTQPDAELLEAWRGGDEHAGAALFERHFAAIRRFFLNKVPGDHEELIQRTFLVCLEARDRFRGDSSLRTFLFGIAHNLLREHYKARARRPGAEPLDTSAVSGHQLAPGPSSVMADKQQHQLLLQSLRRIPLDYQVALELHYWEHLTAAQVGEALGLPVGTAKTRLRRGRQLVEAALQELVDEPQLRRSTISGIDRWVDEVQAQLRRG